jgi:uncharacterized protein (DUF2062 family)
MIKYGQSFRQQLTLWLRQGISPRSLALSFALGFAIGCIPVIGVTTVICGLVALTLGLNLPAILAANYAAFPFQLALILPLARLGGWLISSSAGQAANARLLMHSSVWSIFSQLGLLAGQALLAWLVIAIPTVLFMTVAFTLLLRRVPAVATNSGD